jgi:hypothetical protein
VVFWCIVWGAKGGSRGPGEIVVDSPTLVQSISLNDQSSYTIDFFEQSINNRDQQQQQSTTIILPMPKQKKVSFESKERTTKTTKKKATTKATTKTTRTSKKKATKKSTKQATKSRNPARNSIHDYERSDIINMNPVMDARIQCFWGGTQKDRYERAVKELNYATMTNLDEDLIDDTVLEYRSDDYLSEDLDEDLDFSAFDDE